MYVDARGRERSADLSFGRDSGGRRDAEAGEDRRAGHAVRREAGADIVVVGRTVVDVPVIVVERQQIDGDLRVDGGPLVQRDRAQHQVVDQIDVGGGVAHGQRLPDAPDRSGDQLPAGVDLASAARAPRRELAGVVGVAQGGGALVQEEPVRQAVLARLKDRHRVGHALAVLALAAAAGADDVVAVLMVGHAGERRVGVGARAEAEVDRCAVVKSVARAGRLVGAAEVDVDREIRLRRNDRVGGKILEQERANLVGVHVAVDLGEHLGIGVHRVVNEAGRRGRGDRAGQRLEPAGQIDDVEELTAHQRRDVQRSRDAVDQRVGSVDVGERDFRARTVNLGEREGGRHFLGAFHGHVA